MSSEKNNFYITYKEIYHNRYLYSKNEKKDAKYLIKKNLRECKIGKNDIKNLKVLNVGTGRESFAFIDLKVKECQLVDLSNKTKIKAKIFKKKHKNFYFQINDLCKKNLSLKKFNFLYLNGVFHHLNNPTNALINILKNSETGSKFFFRIYRSGSSKFYAVDYIRKFLKIKNYKKFEKIFLRKFNISKKKMKYDLSHQNPMIHFYEMCVDNFFVPHLNLFNINNFIKVFKLCGLKLIFKSKSQNYNHSNSEKDNTGISLAFEKSGKVKIPNKFKFVNDDQLSDISYKEKYILDSNKLFIKFLPKIKNFQENKRINLAIDLLLITQGHRILKYYNVKKEYKYLKLQSSPKKIHLAIQSRLKQEFSV